MDAISEVDDEIPEVAEQKSVYTWISLDTNDDFDKLCAYIDPEYAPGIVSDFLKNGLSPAVKAVLVEANYVDKDYRSTYYSFYSKKGLYYRSDCVRLHFFDQTVHFDEASLRLSYERAYAGDVNFTDHYFGYMVLRPTGVKTIGRSLINADVVLGAEGRVIDALHKVHVLGYKLLVRGFPWMQQHSDISRCAHAACWAILRHYSERFPSYPERLVSEITMMAHPVNSGGLVPSLGLNVLQAERVLLQAGAFPLRIPRDDMLACDTSFYRQLTAYVESGFPVFVSLPEHAIVIVGYRWRDDVSPNNAVCRHAWDEVQHLLVVDDTQMPYLAIPKQDPPPDNLYSAEGDIDAFIVPLPEKLFYPAEAVEQQVAALFEFHGFLELPSEAESIVRYFVTTGAAFRQFVRANESAYDLNLLQAIMEIPFSQFIWVVEIATEADWRAKTVTARAVLDASASVTEVVPLWLFQTVGKALVFNREQVGVAAIDSMKELEFAGREGFVLTRMEVNLRGSNIKE